MRKARWSEPGPIENETATRENRLRAIENLMIGVRPEYRYGD